MTIIVLINAIKSTRQTNPVCDVRVDSAPESETIAATYIQAFRLGGCNVDENVDRGTYIFPLPGGAADGITVRYKASNTIGNNVVFALSSMHVHSRYLDFPESDPRPYLEFEIAAHPLMEWR
jgi:hypothetical protein